MPSYGGFYRERLFVFSICFLIIANSLVSFIKSMDSDKEKASAILLDGSKKEIEVVGEVQRPRKYLAFVGSNIVNVIKRAGYTHFSDRNKVEKEFFGKKVASNLKIDVPKLKYLTIYALLEEDRITLKLPCGSRVSAVRSRFKKNWIIESKFEKTNRLLKDKEIFHFVKRNG